MPCLLSSLLHTSCFRKETENNMLKIVLFPALLLFGVVVGDQCPPETLTRPCVCETAGGLTLNCENIKSKDVLEGVFRRTGSIQFMNFQLSHSGIPSIPVKDSIIPKRFNAFGVVESNLTTLFDSTPDAANVISMISLEYVSFSGGIPWAQFRNLKHLRYLNFYGVDVPSLGSGFKNNVNKGLKLLILQNTKTGRLEDGVFSEFKILNDLRIEGGQLRELKRTYFPRPSILGYLGFDGNQITSLPNDIFADMPSLKILSLKRNMLASLSETVFGGVFDQLVALDLRGNPIECVCSIQWMTSREKRTHLNGQCETPENFKGKLLAELQWNDFDACH